MSWKTDLFRPECNIGIDINAIPDNPFDFLTTTKVG